MPRNGLQAKANSVNLHSFAAHRGTQETLSDYNRVMGDLTANADRAAICSMLEKMAAGQRQQEAPLERQP